MREGRGPSRRLGRREFFRLGGLGLMASAVRTSRAGMPPGGRWDPAEVRERAVLTQPNRAECVAFSPDGSLLAAGSYPVPGASPSWITLWETASWKRRSLFEVADCRVHRLAFTPDGASLVAGSLDRARIFALDVATGKVRDIDSNDQTAGRMSPFVFSPDGSILATSTPDGVTLWEVGTWARLQDLGGTRDHHYGLFRRSADAGWEFLGGWLQMMDGTGVALDLAPGAGRNPILRPPGDRFARMPRWWLPRIRGVARPFITQHPASNREGDAVAVLASEENGLAHIDVYSMKDRDHWSRDAIIELPEHSGDVIDTLAFSPEGRSIVGGGGSKLIQSWDVSNGREQPALKGHEGAVVDLAWSPDGALLASAGASDKTVRIWGRPAGR